MTKNKENLKKVKIKERQGKIKIRINDVKKKRTTKKIRGKY